MRHLLTFNDTFIVYFTAFGGEIIAFIILFIDLLHPFDLHINQLVW